MLIYLSKSPKSETDRLISKIVDIYVNNEDNANTWSETIDEGMYVQDFMHKLGDERDHVLLFSKDKKMDFEDDWLKPGDTILVASRFYTKK
jgi:hypothetical protein